MSPEHLIEFGGRAVAEGCPIGSCDRCMVPFATDREAVEHIAGHGVADMAWALLEQKAVIASFMDLVGEDTAEELLGEVEDAAASSRKRQV